MVHFFHGALLSEIAAMLHLSSIYEKCHIPSFQNRILYNNDYLIQLIPELYLATYEFFLLQLMLLSLLNGGSILLEI